MILLNKRNPLIVINNCIIIPNFGDMWIIYEIIKCMLRDFWFHIKLKWI